VDDRISEELVSGGKDVVLKQLMEVRFERMGRVCGNEETKWWQVQQRYLRLNRRRGWMKEGAVILYLSKSKGQGSEDAV
jgi:hypothetical protein